LISVSRFGYCPGFESLVGYIRNLCFLAKSGFFKQKNKMRFERNKKGVSVIVGYVLLVMIGISMSVLVYQWLKFQVEPGDEIKCPDEVSLIIEEIEYNCLQEGYDLIIDVKNKGFFTFNGYIIRVNDDPGAEIGIYVLDEKLDKKIRFLGVVPNEELPKLYRISDVFVLPSLSESTTISGPSAGLLSILSMHASCTSMSAFSRSLPHRLTAIRYCPFISPIRGK